MAHFYQEIGQRIEQLRKSKGYSQEELATLVHMEKDMLVAFEDGRMRIFTDHISKISEVLEVTTDYLIYGNGKTNEKNAFTCRGKL